MATEQKEETGGLVGQVRSLMGKQTRVTIADGRLFSGRLSCFDKQLNVLLNEAEESRPNSGSNEKRQLGAIMIPFKYITDIKVNVNDISHLPTIPNPFSSTPINIKDINNNNTPNEIAPTPSPSPQTST